MANKSTQLSDKKSPFVQAKFIKIVHVLEVILYTIYYSSMKWFEELDEKERDAWETIMVNHAFDIDEWGQARSLLFGLLKKEKKNATEEAARSYLSCCAESIGSVHPLPDLSMVMEEFYQHHGMESSYDQN